jgi:hypothetical protein
VATTLGNYGVSILRLHICAPCEKDIIADFGITAITACKEEADVDRDTIEYFREHLAVDMKHDQLKSTFGEPDDDIGSGLHIYVYHLKDGTKVIVGCTDKIFYARHVNTDDQLILKLI